MPLQTVTQAYDNSMKSQNWERKTKATSSHLKWIKISARSGKSVDAKDFREEFVLDKGKKIVFDIAVASKEIDEKKEWQTIGSITFDASVVSDTCDHRLHFHHPVWRDDLRYTR